MPTIPKPRLTWNTWSCRVGGALLLLAAATAEAQKYTPPPPPLTAAPCKPTKKDPCTTPAPAPALVDAHPFPGEPPADGKQASPADGNEAHPFPGEPPVSDAHPFPGEPETAPASPAASSSSSSSSSTVDEATDAGDSGKPELQDKGSSGSNRFMRRHLPKVEDKDRREQEDLEVSKYYASTGNFQAAYLRAKDAVATIADDPEAHFAMAATAQRLKKNEEAAAEYKTYLALDPEGQHAKMARKALLEVAPK